MNYAEIPPEIAERLGLSEDGKTAHPKDITDAEILYLKFYLRELPELQVLDLRGCGRMTDAGMQRLKEALSKYTVICDDNRKSPLVGFLKDVGLLFIIILLIDIVVTTISGGYHLGVAVVLISCLCIGIGRSHYYYFGKKLFS